MLLRRDSKAAERVVANDEAIDELEREVSQDVLRLLALRQPMARDLREVYSALRISADIERIGDYAANIAKRSMVLNQSAPVAAVRGLPALAKTGQRAGRRRRSRPFAPATTRWPWRFAIATSNWTCSTPACSANC